jgi:uncharacterized protein (TIGR03083 family)
MLTRGEVVEGIQVELVGFGTLVRSLDAREFALPSRCEGWSVGDVGAHLIGAFADITSGRVEGQGTPEVSARQVAERAGCTAASLADELVDVAARTADMLALFDDASWATEVPGYDMTLGQAMASMWCGTYVHAEDIRVAVGRPSERGPGLRACVHLAGDLLGRRGLGPAVLALDGVDEAPVGSGSPGRRVTGDALAFVLAASGRGDPAPFGFDASVNVLG